MKKTIDVCLSPDLVHIYDFDGKIAVVVDVLRATSCMTTALAHGIESIVPVESLEECEELGKQGYLTAAERNGQKLDGFNFGNSPFSYMDDNLKGKSIAVTTTNGTRAIQLAKDRADEVVIGSFLNLKAVSEYVKKSEKDVIVVCAGWKGRVNLEDSMFAGALVAELQDEFSLELDASKISLALYEAGKNDKLAFLAECSHIKRLQKLNIQKDIEFCLKENVYDVVPVLEGNKLILK
jgi:2-phosphosulfolactate phosphatase